MTISSFALRHTAWVLAALSLPAWSETAGALPETVVTATRTAVPLTDLVADVTVIDRETLERRGGEAVGDALARLPGIEMVRNGGPGASTSVYIRGAETRFTAVYIDGVRVDSQSTGGASWENIPLAQIDRIEVVRGPASAVYGSDALGGVIQIFTRKGEGAASPFVALGAGSHGLRKAEAGVAGGNATLDYAVSVAGERSQGYSATETGNPDEDGHARRSASARLGWTVAADQRVEANMLSSDLDAQYDAFGSVVDDHSLHRLRSAALGWQARWSDSYRTQVQVTESRNRYETTPSAYLTETRLRGYLFQNEWLFGEQRVAAALERREDYLGNSSTTPAQTDRAQNGVAVGYGRSIGAHSVQLQARQDHDSEFGAHATGSAAYGYALTPVWRVTASAGTAFRTPTLFQRFSVYGSPDLRAESSRNVEIGARYTQGTTSWGVVVYRSRVRNLITFSAPGPCASAFGCYANTAEAEYAGVTLSGQQRLGAVNLHASFDVQNPHDLSNDHLLARRASHHALLGADTAVAGWTLGADAQLSGARYDNAANTTVLAPYALLHLHAQTRLAQDWTALLRVDNATDAQYQLANNYVTAGRTFYVGLKWAPL